MNELAIALVITLFPGIISTIIAERLTVHQKKWDSFKFSLYSLVFGIASYVVLQSSIYIVDSVQENTEFYLLSVWNIAIDPKSTIVPWEVCVAALLSIPVAFLAVAIVNFKWLNRFAQWINIANKYGDENLFSFFLNSEAIDWVYVRDLENNITYQGRVIAYSENDKIQEVTLSDVTLFRYNDSEELYNIPHIYLSKDLGKFIIEAIPYELLEEQNEEKATN